MSLNVQSPAGHLRLTSRRPSKSTAGPAFSRARAPSGSGWERTSVDASAASATGTSPWPTRRSAVRSASSCFEGPRGAPHRAPPTPNLPSSLPPPLTWLPRSRAARSVNARRSLAGHSLGEYTALVAAGSLSLEDAVRSRPRTRAVDGRSGASKSRHHGGRPRPR